MPEPMTDQTLLWRQIHPSFVRQDRVTSQAFRPTPKDEAKLSCEDGDQITAEASWRRFVKSCASVGVMAISVGECTALELEVIPDGVPVPEHVSIDFGERSKRQREKVAKMLRAKAEVRGWQHGPVAEGDEV